ncbi:MAG: PHP domain-containing protein [Desulfobacterales bacterium]|nr:PHP domain-containing protein [Desulfobacterales bacterium]
MKTKHLKVDLHIHTKEDPEDRISYSAYELIAQASLKGFDVLAITNHQRVTYSPGLKSYAAERGIVLIPGVEATIEGKHILLVNMPFQNSCFNSFEDVLKKKAEDNLVIAPHPYFPGPTCLDRQLEATPHLFDAIEYCHFYNHWMNFNIQAVRFAQKYRLPVVGNSDSHVLDQFGLTYSLVEAEKDPDAIIQAIKAGRVKPVSRPLPLVLLMRIFVGVTISKGPMWKKPLELMLTGGSFIKRVLYGRP